jgi:hypothetical protein
MKVEKNKHGIIGFHTYPPYEDELDRVMTEEEINKLCDTDIWRSLLKAVDEELSKLSIITEEDYDYMVA